MIRLELLVIGGGYGRAAGGVRVMVCWRLDGRGYVLHALS